MHEMISPNLLDQRLAMTNQFEGMSREPFSYEDYETTRQKLIDTIHEKLTARDKEFLLSVKNVRPDWRIYNFERFPAVQWKLQNLQKLKDTNPEKQREQYEALKKRLSS